MRSLALHLARLKDATRAFFNGLLESRYYSGNPAKISRAIFSPRLKQFRQGAAAVHQMEGASLAILGHQVVDAE